VSPPVYAGQALIACRSSLTGQYPLTHRVPLSLPLFGQRYPWMEWVWGHAHYRGQDLLVLGRGRIVHIIESVSLGIIQTIETVRRGHRVAGGRGCW
jgi:hypothetical protein